MSMSCERGDYTVFVIRTKKLQVCLLGGLHKIDVGTLRPVTSPFRDSNPNPWFEIKYHQRKHQIQLKWQNPSSLDQLCWSDKQFFTNLFSSVMSSAVQGMPRVIRDNELTTGLTKASPVVIPDKMPMTTLNLDLDWKIKSEHRNFGNLWIAKGSESTVKWKSCHDSSVTTEREVQTCDACFTGVSCHQQAYY